MKQSNKKFNFYPYPFKYILFLITIIVFFTFPTEIILANPLTYIPIDSWVYPAISQFETLQAFQGNETVATNTLPLTRAEIAYLIDVALSNIQKGKIELKDPDLTLMEKLVKEFQDELTSAILDNLKSTLEFSPYFTQRVDFHNPGNHSKLFSELGIKASLAISENSAIYFDYSVDANYLLEYVRLLNTQLNQAYATFRFPSFEKATPTNSKTFMTLGSIEIPSLKLQIGRDSMKWGPAYQGSLILSGNQPPFDMIKYSATVDLSDSEEGNNNLNFTKFFSLLDPLDGESRYFSGQRLEYKVTPALTLGLSETAIISKESSVLFLNPLPFIPPYYLTWWIADVIGQPSEINSNVSLDMELNIHPGIKLYGEFMVDDLILAPETNPYPNRTGFIAGAYFADPLDSGNTDFRIEYTHINNYVYFPTQSWEDYLYQGEYIGSPLGPDADQLFLEATHRLSDKFNLSLSYTHERHGEGQVGIPLPSDPVIANENIFLSGIIEKQQAYQAEISYNISPQWELSASATLENIKNKDNMVGENERNTYFRLEINYEF